MAALYLLVTCNMYASKEGREIGRRHKKFTHIHIARKHAECPTIVVTKK